MSRWQRGIQPDNVGGDVGSSILLHIREGAILFGSGCRVRGFWYLRGGGGSFLFFVVAGSSARCAGDVRGEKKIFFDGWLLVVGRIFSLPVRVRGGMRKKDPRIFANLARSARSANRVRYSSLAAPSGRRG